MHCLLVLVHICLSMFTPVQFILVYYVYPCLLVITYGYSFLVIFTTVYSCLPLFTNCLLVLVYPCLLEFTNVYSCSLNITPFQTGLPTFTCVYLYLTLLVLTCLLVFNFLPQLTRVSQCIPLFIRSCFTMFTDG